MPGQLQFPTGCCSFMWRFSGIADRFLLLLHPEVDNSQESATLIEFSTCPHSQKLLNCCSKTFVFSQSSSVHISCPFSRGILFPSSFSLPLCPAEPVSFHCSTPGEQAVPPHSIISKAFQPCHRTWSCRSCYTYGCAMLPYSKMCRDDFLQYTPSPGHGSISLGYPAGLQATHQTNTPFL